MPPSLDSFAAASCSGWGRDTSLARMAALSVIFIAGIDTSTNYPFQPAHDQSRGVGWNHRKSLQGGEAVGVERPPGRRDGGGGGAAGAGRSGRRGRRANCESQRVAG